MPIKIRDLVRRLIPIARRRKRELIIAHGDVDGVISAVIAARSLELEDAEVYFSGPRSIDRALSKVPDGGERLVIVDVAMNPDKVDAVESELRRLRDSGWNVLWIDHHIWPDGVVDRLSRYVDVRVRPAPSAARVVLEELGGRDYERELANIADDADTATYRDERAKMYNALTRDREKRAYLVEALMEGRLEDEKVVRWAREKLRDQERRVEEGLRRVRVLETASGRRFALIDLRPRGGPGSLISKRLSDEVDFSLVLYSCNKFSLYAGRDRSVDLRPICEEHGGGGHPYACGGKIEMNILRRILCLLLGHRYFPREVRDLVEEVKARL